MDGRAPGVGDSFPEPVKRGHGNNPPGAPRPAPSRPQQPIVWSGAKYNADLREHDQP